MSPPLPYASGRRAGPSSRAGSVAAALILIAGLVPAGAALAGAREPLRLRLGVEAAYPPFNEMGPDGRPRGLDVDLGDALCAQMRARCTWVVQDWDGMLPAVHGQERAPERLLQVAAVDDPQAHGRREGGRRFGRPATALRGFEA